MRDINMIDRIKKIQNKISRLEIQNREDKKDLAIVKRWAKKNPTKELNSPWQGLLTPDQLKNNIKQHQARIKRQSDEIKERKARLKKLKRG